LAARLSVDPGHLHFHVRRLHRAGLIERRIERGARKPPELPHLVRITEALNILENSLSWHELFAAAARDRFESLSFEGFTYLGFENPLHGLPEEPQPPHTVTLTEAAFEIGKISESLGVEKITVKASDGSEFCFNVGKGKGRDQSD